MSDISQTKVCYSCKVEKHESEFKRRDKKLHSYCDPCRKQKMKDFWQANREEQLARSKEYREKNKETLDAKRKQYREENRQKLRDIAIEYHYNNRDKILDKNRQNRLDNLEEHRQRDIEYRLKNHDKMIQQGRARYNKKRIERLLNSGLTLEQIQQMDEEKAKKREENKDRLAYKAQWMKKKAQGNVRFKIDRRHSKAIYSSLVEKYTTKEGQTWKEIVGYTVDELQRHLESLFDEHMSWDNYGIYWQIDHIIPKKWYAYESKEDPEFRKCWSLKNLQPLSKTDNASKRHRYAGTPSNRILKEELYDDTRITDEDLRRLRPDQARNGVFSEQKRSARSPVLLQTVCSDSSEEVPPNTPTEEVQREVQGVHPALPFQEQGENPAEE